MAYKYTFSILIPSLRPDKLKECIDSIKIKTEESDDLKYEIIVDTQEGGVYSAVDRMFSKAQGEYIVHIPDDCKSCFGWLNEMLSLMRKHDNEIFEGAFRTYNEYENPHGDYYYFGKKFAGFICIRTDVAIKLGGLIDQRYKCFYGDPDLSMRVYEAGGAVEHAENSLIYYLDKHDEVKVNNLKKYEGEDELKFKERWISVFGEYKGCERKPLNV